MSRVNPCIAGGILIAFASGAFADDREALKPFYRQGGQGRWCREDPGRSGMDSDAENGGPA
jgi:hypothetical protein